MDRTDHSAVTQFTSVLAHRRKSSAQSWSSVWIPTQLGLVARWLIACSYSGVSNTGRNCPSVFHLQVQYKSPPPCGRPTAAEAAMQLPKGCGGPQPLPGLPSGNRIALDYQQPSSTRRYSPRAASPAKYPCSPRWSCSSHSCAERTSAAPARLSIPSFACVVPAGSPSPLRHPPSLCECSREPTWAEISFPIVFGRRVMQGTYPCVCTSVLA